MEHTGADFPQHPREQLDLAIEAVLGSWNTERARLYRRRERIPHDLGTAVNVVSMVFGNLGETSGTGVCFTRDPSTGHSRGVRRLPAERPGRGRRRRHPQHAAARRPRAARPDVVRGSCARRCAGSRRTTATCATSSSPSSAASSGCCRPGSGKRTAAAAFRIATELVDESLITMDEAIDPRARATSSASCCSRSSTRRRRAQLLTRAMPAPLRVPPSARSCSTTRRPLERDGEAGSARHPGPAGDQPRRPAGHDRRRRRPDRARRQDVARRGRRARHGHVRRRRCRGASTSTRRGEVRVGDVVLQARRHDRDRRRHRRGVPSATVPVVDSPVMVYVADGLEAGARGGGRRPEARALVDAVRPRAPARRRRATAAGARQRRHRRGRRTRARPRRRGHRPVPHRAPVPRRPAACYIERARPGRDRRRARRRRWTALLPLQRQDFVELLEAMDGLPTTIRLIDPPLHEFLPDLTELAVKVAVAEERETDPHDVDAPGRRAPDARAEPDARPARRAARAALPGPVRAAGPGDRRGDCVELRKQGGTRGRRSWCRWSGRVRELQLVRDEAERVLEEVSEETGERRSTSPIGCMIELPRAALTAHRIAEEADFFSFGTNDLTQTTWGFSRDDVERRVLRDYLQNGVLTISPFETLDADGVGQLVRAGRRGRPVDEAGAAHGRLRRARRRPRVDPLLPRRRAGLRVLLAVPGADRPAGGRPGDGVAEGRRVAAGASGSSPLTV